MLHASTRKLIDRLAEMTELGKLDWTEGASGQINYSTEGYSVSLTEGPNELVITSKDGKELERASAEELASTQSESGIAYAEIVAAMTMEASRIARGTEVAISTLLAGMESSTDGSETASVVETSEPTVVEAETLPEDPVDETMDLATETIESISPEPTDVTDEPTEASSDALPSEPVDEPETETTFAADSLTTETERVADQVETSETVVSNEDEVAAIETIEAAPELEAAFDAESETEVTEAVARLADEVNQREDSTLNAAAASAVGAVALAAGLTQEDAPEEESGTEAVSEPAPSIEVAPAAEESPLSLDEGALDTPPAYVPFGLGTDEPASEPLTFGTVAEDTVSETPEAQEEAASEPEVTETVVPFAVNAESSPEADTVEDTAEPQVAATEPEIEPTTIPLATSYSEEPEETVTLDVSSSETPETETSEIETTAFAEVHPTESTIAVAELVQTEPEAPEETVATAEAHSSTTFADISDPLPESVETPPVSFDLNPATTPETPSPVEAPAETPVATDSVSVEPSPAPAPEAQTYSLSGIGAGFGLGALSAKTEASGIPGPTASDSGSDKIVIDATDDVLPKPEGKVSLPEGYAQAKTATPTTSAEAPAEDQDDAESDILKPRTRFNPWD